LYLLKLLETTSHLEQLCSEDDDRTSRKEHSRRLCLRTGCTQCLGGKTPDDELQ
jgi:hypothetical protein